MSDFLYTTAITPAGELERLLHTIHPWQRQVRTFQGPWGQLALLDDHYGGYAPFEDERYLLFVTGGPLLRLRGEPPRAPTAEQVSRDARLSQALLDRWCRSGTPDWTSELSGPFVVGRADKQRGEIIFVTDPVGFLPLYRGQANNGHLVIGTHPDLVAQQAGRFSDIDPTALVDLLINRTVCYPHTLYRNVSEMPPGTLSTLRYSPETGVQESSHTYWLPLEQDMETDLDAAAACLREAVGDYINQVSGSVDRIAMFLSGGEDSRAIAGAVPRHIERHGHVFVDHANRESRIACHVAEVLGIHPHVSTRTPDRYLRNLAGCTRLIGAQYEYVHVHAFGYEQECRLADYPAVLGGSHSDIFVKALYVPTRRFQRFGIALPEHGVVRGREEAGFSVDAWYRDLQSAKRVFAPDLVDEVYARRLAHYDRVAALRPESAAEWTHVWPQSQGTGSADITGYRRLFRSFEVFTDIEIVKLSARTPLAWKLNRRLFQRAMKPFLRPTWMLPHAAEGFFPYFSTNTNIFLRPGTILYWKLRDLIRGPEDNPGPWPVYSRLVASQAMQDLEQSLLQQHGELLHGIVTEDLREKPLADWLSPLQRLQLAQLLWSRSGLFQGRPT